MWRQRLQQLLAPAGASRSAGMASLPTVPTAASCAPQDALERWRHEQHASQCASVSPQAQLGMQHPHHHQQQRQQGDVDPLMQWRAAQAQAGSNSTSPAAPQPGTSFTSDTTQPRSGGGVAEVPRAVEVLASYASSAPPAAASDDPLERWRRSRSGASSDALAEWRRRFAEASHAVTLPHDATGATDSMPNESTSQAEHQQQQHQRQQQKALTGCDAAAAKQGVVCADAPAETERAPAEQHVATHGSDTLWRCTPDAVIVNSPHDSDSVLLGSPERPARAAAQPPAADPGSNVAAPKQALLPHDQTSAAASEAVFVTGDDARSWSHCKSPQQPAAPPAEHLDEQPGATQPALADGQGRPPPPLQHAASMPTSGPSSPPRVTSTSSPTASSARMRSSDALSASLRSAAASSRRSSITTTASSSIGGESSALSAILGGAVAGFFNASGTDSGDERRAASSAAGSEWGTGSRRPGSAQQAHSLAGTPARSAELQQQAAAQVDTQQAHASIVQAGAAPAVDAQPTEQANAEDAGEVDSAVCSQAGDACAPARQLIADDVQAAQRAAPGHTALHASASSEHGSRAASRYDGTNDTAPASQDSSPRSVPDLQGDCAMCAVHKAAVAAAPSPAVIAAPPHLQPLRVQLALEDAAQAVSVTLVPRSPPSALEDLEQSAMFGGGRTAAAAHDTSQPKAPTTLHRDADTVAEAAAGLHAVLDAPASSTQISSKLAKSSPFAERTCSTDMAQRRVHGATSPRATTGEPTWDAARCQNLRSCAPSAASAPVVATADCPWEGSSVGSMATGVPLYGDAGDCPWDDGPTSRPALMDGLEIVRRHSDDSDASVAGDVQPLPAAGQLDAAAVDTLAVVSHSSAQARVPEQLRDLTSSEPVHAEGGIAIGVPVPALAPSSSAAGRLLQLEQTAVQSSSGAARAAATLRSDNERTARPSAQNTSPVAASLDSWLAGLQGHSDAPHEARDVRVMAPIAEVPWLEAPPRVCAQRAGSPAQPLQRLTDLSDGDSASDSTQAGQSGLRRKLGASVGDEGLRELLAVESALLGASAHDAASLDRLRHIDALERHAAGTR